MQHIKFVMRGRGGKMDTLFLPMPGFTDTKVIDEDVAERYGAVIARS